MAEAEDTVDFLRRLEGDPPPPSGGVSMEPGVRWCRRSRGWRGWRGLGVWGHEPGANVLECASKHQSPARKRVQRSRMHRGSRLFNGSS